MMTDAQPPSDPRDTHEPAKAAPQTDGSPVPPDSDQPGESQPLTKDECNWAMYCHLSALCALLGVPFGNVLGPMVVWMIKKDEMPVVERHGQESMNFQITLSIGISAASLLALVLVLMSLIPFVMCVTIPLLIVLAMVIVAAVMVSVVFVIQASIAASKGEFFEYPLTWRLIK